MKRLGLILTMLAIMAFAGPVSAASDTWRARFRDPGIDGKVSITLNGSRTAGTIHFRLHSLQDGNASIDVNAGRCGNSRGDIVMVWVKDHNFVDGNWVNHRDLPSASVRLFKQALRAGNGISVTVRNEGRWECRRLYHVD